VVAAVSYFMVDVEADGPIPERYSIVAIGAVVVEPGLQRTFYGRLRPISEQFIPTALAVSGFSRADM
jgi:DNA polymerase III epsilon subunit-like protein